MPKKLRLALVAALAIAGFAVLPAAALADDGSREAPSYAYVSGEEPTWVNPQAHMSCPMCVFAAGAAIRAAFVLRAAAVARAVIIAARAARAAAKAAEKVTRATVRRVQRDARVISRRSSKWVKKRWPTFKYETKVCLATAAFMKGAGFLKDRVLDSNEWSRYAIFGPRLVSPNETLAINFPIRFSASELANKAGEEAISCAVGVGFARYFGKGADAPRPK
jgi:hypothetical protein